MKGTPVEARARELGIPVLPLPASDPGLIGAIRRLRRNLQAERPEILHAHDARGLNLAWLASQGLPIRRVVNRDVTFHPKFPGGRRLQSWKYSHTADLVLTCSDHIKQSLIRSGVPPSKIEVIYAAIEWPEQLPPTCNQSRSRAEWGFGEDEFVAGHVGAFTPEKGQDIAIEAAALLKLRQSNIRMVLAGEVSKKALLELRRRYPGFEDHVRLPGYVPDLGAFFSCLDLFIMPSRGEGLGISALQAMAWGLAVVATNVGGLAEVVEDGETGWLVPPDDPAALAEAIARAASDRARLREMGLKARERARQFSSKLMVERTEELYKKLSVVNSKIE